MVVSAETSKIRLAVALSNRMENWGFLQRNDQLWIHVRDLDHSYYTIGCCTQYGQHFWRVLWQLHIRGFCSLFLFFFFLFFLSFLDVLDFLDFVSFHFFLVFLVLLFSFFSFFFSHFLFLFFLSSPSYSLLPILFFLVSSFLSSSSKLCYRSRSQWVWQFWGSDRSGLIIPNWQLFVGHNSWRE